MAQMTDEEKRRALEMFKQQAMGPAGIQGPRGAIFPTNGATVSEPTRRSFTDNVRNTIRQNTPSGAYGFDQTVGPLLGAINPLPSWKRTFTAKNLRKYANPNSGLDWKQRLALGAEDALNLLAVGSLAKAAANPIMNDTYLFGKTLVHGSPAEITGYIEPRLGSNVMPKNEVAFALDPSSFKHWGSDMPHHIIDSAKMYSGGNGNIYITRAKRNQINRLWDIPNTDIVYTTGPQKVISSVKIPAFETSYDGRKYSDIVSEFAQSLARSGVREPIPKPSFKLKNKFKIIPTEDSPV